VKYREGVKVREERQRIHESSKKTTGRIFIRKGEIVNGESKERTWRERGREKE
jgi:hypothetical protein